MLLLRSFFVLAEVLAAAAEGEKGIYVRTVVIVVLVVVVVVPELLLEVVDPVVVVVVVVVVAVLIGLVIVVAAVVVIVVVMPSPPLRDRRQCRNAFHVWLVAEELIVNLVLGFFSPCSQHLQASFAPAPAAGPPSPPAPPLPPPAPLAYEE